MIMKTQKYFRAFFSKQNKPCLYAPSHSCPEVTDSRMALCCTQWPWDNSHKGTYTYKPIVFQGKLVIGLSLQSAKLFLTEKQEIFLKAD